MEFTQRLNKAYQYVESDIISAYQKADSGYRFITIHNNQAPIK